MVLIGLSIHLSCLLGEVQLGPLPHPQEVRELCRSHKTKHTGLHSTGCHSDAGISRQGLCGESRDWRCPRLPLAASQEPLFAFTTPSVPRPASAGDLNQEPRWYEFGLRSAQRHEEKSSEEWWQCTGNQERELSFHSALDQGHLGSRINSFSLKLTVHD